MLRSVVQPFLLFFNQEVVMESFPLVRERFYPAWVMALAAAAVFGRLAFETVRLEIDMSENGYKAKDFDIEVAKRSEPSRIITL